MPIAPAPPPLPELQRWLRWAITDPAGPGAALAGARAPGGLRRRPEPRPRRLDAIIDAPPTGAVARLGVYADAYFLRLLEALGGDFPVARRTLGEERFRRLCADYLAARPSGSWNIGDAGEDLPGFSRSHPLSGDFPFLGDLTSLEWAVFSSLNSARDMPAHGAPSGDWERARLMMSPAARLLRADWAVDRLWTGAVGSLRKPSARWLLVHRDARWARVRALPEPAWSALETLSQGRALGKVCAALTRKGVTAASVRRWFSCWSAWGLIGAA